MMYIERVDGVFCTACAIFCSDASKRKFVTKPFRKWNKKRLIDWLKKPILPKYVKVIQRITMIEAQKLLVSIMVHCRIYDTVPVFGLPGWNHSDSNC